MGFKGKEGVGLEEFLRFVEGGREFEVGGGGFCVFIFWGCFLGVGVGVL